MNFTGRKNPYFFIKLTRLQHNFYDLAKFFFHKLSEGCLMIDKFLNIVKKLKIYKQVRKNNKVQTVLEF